MIRTVIDKRVLAVAKSQDKAASTPYPKVGAKAPAFTAVDAGGRKVKLSALVTSRMRGSRQRGWDRVV